MNKIEQILKYQEVDMKLRAVEQEIENSEDFRRANRAKNEYTEARTRMDSCEKKAEDLMAHFAKLQSELASAAEKIEEIDDDAKEYTEDDDTDYIITGLHKLNENIRNLEQEINNVIKNIDDIARVNEESKKYAYRCRAIFDDSKKKFDAFKETKQGIIKKYNAELEAIEKVSDPTLMSKYHALRKDRVFPPFTPVFENNHCGSCRMEFSMNTVGDLKSKGYVECDSCRRVIYNK